MNSVSQLPWAAYAQLSAAIEMWAIKQVLHILEQILSRCAEWSTPWAVFYTLNICVRQRLNLEPGSSCRGVYCSHTSNTAAACARGYYAGPFPCHVDKLLFCQSRIRALREMASRHALPALFPGAELQTLPTLTTQIPSDHPERKQWVPAAKVGPHQSADTHLIPCHSPLCFQRGRL